MSGENKVSRPDIMKKRQGGGKPDSFISKLIFGVVYNLIFWRIR